MQRLAGRRCGPHCDWLLSVGPSLTRLAAIAGPPLAQAPPASIDRAGRRHEELTELLAVRNGFFAFEGALHVFPSGTPAVGPDLASWNSHDGWRSCYGEMAKGLFFFAEDIFGVQFAIKAATIVTFDPETGEVVPTAATLDDWAQRVLTHHRELTRYPLAHSWQEKRGELPPGQRLLPKRPFVLGGEFNVDNLYAHDAYDGMRMRGEVAVQLAGLTDGTPVEFNVGD